MVQNLLQETKKPPSTLSEFIQEIPSTAMPVTSKKMVFVSTTMIKVSFVLIDTTKANRPRPLHRAPYVDQSSDESCCYGISLDWVSDSGLSFWRSESINLYA